MRVMVSLLLALAPSLSDAGAAEIEDSRGLHRFDAPPERVVALSWSLAEQLSSSA